ncbi:hypothetical protein LC608_33615 [Nostoc sp. XA010]|uniref:group II intron maturase-specific domain-containing protein n=1 Tax=Nostoc sp. XA010 TaxID=2780407 RepID=UPI0035A85225|nr:hypothetical protein [Nostoc sp. XA010]
MLYCSLLDRDIPKYYLVVFFRNQSTVLIRHLNPIIRGWANYYATVVSKVAYTDMDNLTYQKL